MNSYEVYIHRSLTLPIFWMGVPRNVLLLEVLGGVLCGVIFKTFIVIPIICIIHAIMVWLGKQDPQFIDVFMDGKNHKLYYYP